MRREYEMTAADLKRLLDSMKPDPVMYLPGGMPLFRNQQDKVNDAWTELGSRMGFKPMSVRPCGKGARFFTAEPSETE